MVLLLWTQKRELFLHSSTTGTSPKKFVLPWSYFLMVRELSDGVCNTKGHWLVKHNPWDSYNLCNALIQTASEHVLVVSRNIRSLDGSEIICDYVFTNLTRTKLWLCIGFTFWLDMSHHCLFFCEECGNMNTLVINPELGGSKPPPDKTIIV